MKIKTDWQCDESGIVTGIDNGNCRVLVARVFGCDVDQRDAHARLIAAAPTMWQYLINKAADGCEKAKEILKTLD